MKEHTISVASQIDHSRCALLRVADDYLDEKTQETLQMMDKVTQMLTDVTVLKGDVKQVRDETSVCKRH